MSGYAIRAATRGDRAAIRDLLTLAFEGPVEAELVDRLVAGGHVVLELVAERDGAVIGHVLFSRLTVDLQTTGFDAVALAPLAVSAANRREGVGAALVETAHRQLREAGEVLSVVLGDPAYYGRFGYAHARAAGFASDYQCEALQALAWGVAPATGRLVYAAPFAEL